MEGIGKIKKACFISKDGSRQVMLIQKEKGVKVITNNDCFMHYQLTINQLVDVFKICYNLTYMEVE